MTKKIVTRALIMAGLVVASATASFAQAAVASKVRRVAVDQENQQPVAASTVILDKGSSLNLTADQRTQIASMNTEVSALHAERDRLWAEYKAVKARPDFSDEIAEKEAGPRMRRIVEINAQLAPLAAKQESRIASILNASQRTQLGQMVSAARARF